MERNRVHAALRAATFECHQRVDEIYSAAQLDDRMSYGNFLCAQAAALLPVEAALDQSGIADLVEDWAERNRGRLLIRDMAELGIPRPEPIGRPIWSGPSEMLGALYVLEGSRLGGKLLRRSVPTDFPTNFLAAEHLGSWALFLIRLGKIVDTDAARTDAITGARAVFSLFEKSGRFYL